MIFALFYIFTSLRVSSSTVDGQGLITVAVRIHLFDGMSRWASGVLVSPGVCLDHMKRVRERQQIMVIVTIRGKRWRRSVPHNNKFFSHSSFALENPSFAIWVNWASKSSCRSINSAKWSEKIVRLITWSFWTLFVRYDTQTPNKQESYITHSHGEFIIWKKHRHNCEEVDVVFIRFDGKNGKVGWRGFREGGNLPFCSHDSTRVDRSVTVTWTNLSYFGLNKNRGLGSLITPPNLVQKNKKFSVILWLKWVPISFRLHGKGEILHKELNCASLQRNHYRCWIVWGKDIRVIIIPSFLAIAYMGQSSITVPWLVAIWPYFTFRWHRLSKGKVELQYLFSWFVTTSCIK